MRSGIGAKFFNIVNKDKNNQEDSGNIINERFNEAKVDWLYCYGTATGAYTVGIPPK